VEKTASVIEREQIPVPLNVVDTNCEESTPRLSVVRSRIQLAQIKNLARKCRKEKGTPTGRDPDDLESLRSISSSHALAKD
jgi:hypothetical protein